MYDINCLKPQANCQAYCEASSIYKIEQIISILQKKKTYLLLQLELYYIVEKNSTLIREDFRLTFSLHRLYRNSIEYF